MRVCATPILRVRWSKRLGVECEVTDRWEASGDTAGIADPGECSAGRSGLRSYIGGLHLCLVYIIIANIRALSNWKCDSLCRGSLKFSSENCLFRTSLPSTWCGLPLFIRVADKVCVFAILIEASMSGGPSTINVSLNRTDQLKKLAQSIFLISLVSEVLAKLVLCWKNKDAQPNFGAQMSDGQTDFFVSTTLYERSHTVKLWANSNVELSPRQKNCTCCVKFDCNKPSRKQSWETLKLKIVQK